MSPVTPPIDREDVVSIMEALFDIRVNTDRILVLLMEDDDEETEQEEDLDS